jgi:hypothetical protein
MEPLAVIRQAFRGRKHEPCTGLRMALSVQGRPKNETDEEESQDKLTIFFHIKRTVHKEFVLAGHTVNSAHIVTFYV